MRKVSNENMQRVGVSVLLAMGLLTLAVVQTDAKDASVASQPAPISTQPTTTVSQPATKPVKVKPNTTQPSMRTWPQWSDYHKRYCERAKAGSKWPVKIVFFGDSITEWWPWQDFKARYGSKMGAVNFGIGGDQVQHLLWRIHHGEMDGMTPKVAVVLIGTNNLGDNSPEEVAAGITKVVEAIHEKGPTTKVLLLGIFPRADYEELKKRAQKVNAIIAKLDDGGKTVRFADIGQNFLNPDGKVKEGVLKDKLHLTSKGYDMWHQAMQPILEEMLGQTATQPTTTSSK